MQLIVNINNNMDPFRIKFPFDKPEFIKENLIRYEIQSINNRKIIKQNTIFATALLGFGIFAIYDDQPNNPAFIFGLILESIMILFAFILIISKRKFKNAIIEQAEKYESVKMDCVFEFSDISIKYWDKEKLIDFKWELFSSYSFYKNYLVICINNSLTNSYLFEKKNSENENYNKIFELVQQKLEFKEIKVSKPILNRLWIFRK